MRLELEEHGTRTFGEPSNGVRRRTQRTHDAVFAPRCRAKKHALTAAFAAGDLPENKGAI